MSQSWLACVNCGYDLRSTSEYRCPECGEAFHPVELREYNSEHASEKRAKRLTVSAFARLAIVAAGCFAFSCAIRAAFEWFVPSPTGFFCHFTNGQSLAYIVLVRDIPAVFAVAAVFFIGMGLHAKLEKEQALAAEFAMVTFGFVAVGLCFVLWIFTGGVAFFD